MFLCLACTNGAGRGAETGAAAPKPAKQIVLDVQVDEAMEKELQRIAESFRGEPALAASRMRVQGRTLVAEGVPATARTALNTALERLWPGGFESLPPGPGAANTLEFRLTEAAATRYVEQLLSQECRVLEKRLAESGFPGKVARDAGNAGRVRVSVSGEANPGELKAVLSLRSLLEFRFVHPEDGQPASREILLAKFGGKLPEGCAMFPAAEGQRVPPDEFYLLESGVVLTGAAIADAQAEAPGEPESWGPRINFRLTPEGAARFADATGNNIRRRLAIVLDGKVLSAPTIQERITDRGVITGGLGSLREARTLAAALRAGALPAAVVVVE